MLFQAENHAWLLCFPASFGQMLSGVFDRLLILNFRSVPGERRRPYAPMLLSTYARITSNPRPNHQLLLSITQAKSPPS